MSSFAIINKSLKNETKLHVDKASITSLDINNLLIGDSGSLTVMGVSITSTQLSNIPNIGSIN